MFRNYLNKSKIKKSKNKKEKIRNQNNELNIIIINIFIS